MKLLRQRSATHGRRAGNRRERSSSRPFLRRIPCDNRARPSPDRIHPRPARGSLFQRDGEMLAEYGAMGAMELLPQEIVGREMDMEAAAEIDEHQP